MRIISINIMKRKNPTSPIRQGLDYQDLWGLHLCGDWLNNPDKYQWIWFETCPSDDLQGGFFLDDIVLFDDQGRFHLYQVKHKQNPGDDAWNWEDFLTRERGKNGQLKDSLLQKWFKSFFKPDLEDRIGRAAFITNGLAEDDINSILKNQKIDIQTIQQQSPRLYETIRGQLGNEEAIKSFFSSFEFLFGQHDASQFESQIRDFFYKKLRATEGGVNKLLLQIHTEARRPHTGAIILEQIRQWCEFDQPRPLNEHFEIPTDFEFFDGVEHERIIKDLLCPLGGIKVIYGKPGTGKSTYISKLHDLLREKGIISIRHHYHISPNDPDPLVRLRASRVIEALKAQFKEYSEELGQLSQQNSGNVALHEYIAALAGYAKKERQSFVLIVDGLDHVLRQGHEDELRSFLSGICHPQPGLWIVFGMQEIAEQYLPQIVYEKTPKVKWIEIKGLNQGAVDRIFDTNIIGLNLPDRTDSLCNLSDNLYQISKGNPLHLRYTLKQLKNQLRDGLLTEFAFNYLLPYDGDITNYYDSLWRRLPSNAKTVGVIISCVEFQFKKSQLLDLISTFITNPAVVTESFLAVSHLLSENNEKLSVYHNSFRAFLANQSEYKDQEIPSKRIIRKWLEESRWEDLKWAELRRLSYYLGNAEPILQIDRPWLIDAICCLREPRLITSQLRIGKEAAFKAGRYGKVLELSVLESTFENAQSFIDDAFQKIWKVAYAAAEPDYLDFNLSELAADQIPVVTKDAVGHGDTKIVPKAIERLNTFHRDLNVRTKGDIGSGLPQLAVRTIETLTLDRKHKCQRLFEYVKHFRESGWSADLYTLYVDLLLKNKEYGKLDDVLKSDLTDLEFQEILRKCAVHDNTSRENRFVNLISSRHDFLSYSCLVYLRLRGKPINGIPALPPYTLFPIEVAEYESGKREERAKIFSENFTLGLLYALLGREDEIRKWISNANERWSINIMSALLAAAIDISNQMKVDKKVNVKRIFESLSRVPALEWAEHRDLYELQICLQYSLTSILQFIMDIRSYTEGQVGLSEDEVNCILACKYYNRKQFLDYLLTHKEPLLTKEAYETFMAGEISIWAKAINGFPERAEHYADLGNLANIHGDVTQRDNLVRLAADNLLGYGYHKDLFLDLVLEAIEACHKTGSKKAVTWIRRLAPAIENVTEYTDGDETNYIPRHLAELLAIISPDDLYKYHYQNAADERLFLAEESFASVIQSLKFEQEVDGALATTALDQKSFDGLELAALTNPKAQRALDAINAYLGERGQLTESDEPSERRIREAVDYSSVKPDKIEGHLASMETEYDRERYLANWLDYWLSAANVEKRFIYDIGKSLVLKGGFHNADGRILDTLYPMAHEHEEEEKAFEILCWAQANHGGWDRYYTDKKHAIKRWEFVSKYYAKRYLEFFEKSVFYCGMQYGRGGNYFVPLPRAIEFFAIFNNLRLMEEVTESAVASMESMMADLALPESKWVSVAPVDQFDILLQRLFWPSPLVRERAACAIAELLNYGEDRRRLFDRYLIFLREQKLESLTAVVLLPVIKALERKDGLSTYADLTGLLSSIPFSSIVIEKLAHEISYLLNQETRFKSHRRSALAPPADYEPHKFFTKHIRGFLAPAYSERANTIGATSGVDFSKYWAFNSQNIAAELNIEEQAGDAINFMGYHPPRMLGMSTKLSEVYRSAFLRTVQLFYDNSLIQIDMYHRYALATLPVELSFWKIKTNRAPAWWPRVKHETGKESYTKEIVKFAFPYDDVEALVRRNGKTTILGIKGTAEPQKGWRKGVPDTSIDLAGFAYKINGPNIPAAEVVARKILDETFLFTLARILQRPFNVLECPDQYLPSQTEPEAIDDMTIYPLIAPIRQSTISLWQWFRGNHPYMLLFKPASAENVIRLEDSGLSHYKRGRLIAHGQDWTEGLQDRLNLEAPHGTFIEADTDYLNECLNENGFRLGYVIRTTHKIRRYSTDEEQSIEGCRFIGVGRIIM